jgi:threonine/homoserine/homoserine lactone efflux protein
MASPYLLLEFIAVCIYAILGARRSIFTYRPQIFQWLNRLSGTLLIGFGAMLAFVRCPPM